MRIFVSHAAVDRPLAGFISDHLRDDSESRSVFLASSPGSIPADSEWLGVIQRELRAADSYLVLVTANSVARPWVLFEAGAAWMTGKPLVVAIAGTVQTTDVPMPLSARQLARLDRQSDVAEVFRVFDAKCPDVEVFVSRVKKLSAEVEDSALHEAGWGGVEVGGVFYAWTGPLLQLDDRQPVHEPPGLIEAIRREGLNVGWSREDTLARHQTEGKFPIYATDRKSWRRIVRQLDTVLIAGPINRQIAEAGRAVHEDDAKVMLLAWVKSRSKDLSEQAVFFADVDKELALPKGTALRPLESQAREAGFAVTKKGPTSILFHRPRPQLPGSMSVPTY